MVFLRFASIRMWAISVSSRLSSVTVVPNEEPPTPLWPNHISTLFGSLLEGLRFNVGTSSQYFYDAGCFASSIHLSLGVFNGG